ncbi:ABC transporter ATP-binding protein [Coprobacillus cateniformis]|uniref:ABC transporter ATP-binding protein n=1 Tax=Coprobacillus cateniformis TaxID=100884 RepID=UPI00399F2480
MYLNVKGVKKFYGQGEGRIMVLKGIECIIEKGEICVLLGPSGSGKSTLLNLIGGIEDIDEGSIFVDQQDLGVMSSKELGQYRRKTLGFIFQSYHLVPHLTVKENIESGAYLSSSPIDIHDLLLKLGLEEHKNKYPNQLSGGQQQRTAIGRALAKNPSLLLCDEPTGALDYYTSKDILELLERLHQDYGTTILIVTHNDAIAKMAHRIMYLKDGQIVNIQMNPQPMAAKDIEW